jgi:hypothetical protein
MPVGLPEGSVHTHRVIKETARPTRGEKAISQLKTETSALLTMTVPSYLHCQNKQEIPV